MALCKGSDIQGQWTKEMLGLKEVILLIKLRFLFYYSCSP